MMGNCLSGLVNGEADHCSPRSAAVMKLDEMQPWNNLKADRINSSTRSFFPSPSGPISPRADSPWARDLFVRCSAAGFFRIVFRYFRRGHCVSARHS